MFKVGDYVTRKSYDNDIIFKISNINDSLYILKGINVRLLADSNEDDLIHYDGEKKTSDLDLINRLDEKLDRGDFFYLPGKILHIDGDCEYLDRCLKLYKKFNVMAYGICIKEHEMSSKIKEYLDK